MTLYTRFALINIESLANSTKEFREVERGNMLATARYMGVDKREDLEREDSLVPKTGPAKKGKVQISLLNPEEILSVDSGLENLAICDCLMDKFLCPKGKELIRSLYFEGKSLNEISMEMQISTNKVMQLRNVCLNAMRTGKKVILRFDR